MDLKNHDETKKIAKKYFFGLNLHFYLSNKQISLKFHMVIAICLNLNL